MADYDRDHERNLGGRGPAREDIIEQQEKLRNDLGAQASDQVQPDGSRQAGRDETGTARRAEKASGLSPEPNHLGEAEQAFEESRGSDEPRPDPGA